MVVCGDQLPPPSRRSCDEHLHLVGRAGARAAWDPFLTWFTGLRQGGLTSAMVGMDFLPHRIAPLQTRLRSTWFYTGNNNACLLARGADSNLSKDVLASLIDQFREVDLWAALIPYGT